jgi:hypothetical protein
MQIDARKPRIDDRIRSLYSRRNARLRIALCCQKLFERGDAVQTGEL